MTLEQIVKDLEKQGYIVKTIFPILSNSFGFNDNFENLINDNGFWLEDIKYPEGQEAIKFGEDIEDSNFERTMLEYLNAKMGKFKGEHYDISITDNNRLYRIHVDVMVLDKDKEKNKE